MGGRNRLGRDGEELAQQYLEACGVVVLERNWRCRDGELDIIATDGESLIVCEVKTRSGTGYGQPAEAVSAAKVARIRRLAYRWLSIYCVPWVPVRFDVLAIVWRAGDGPAIRHIEGAF
ncbi:YraN family protein [Haloechinothrix sp. YIM 98757]|uniref:UPF0102 protein H0B56_22055 n=1 Tax=Haloechinothrix aidingensis TaxID=2752311 RepID=A0A838AGN1_9PSEU|nr:YraN family protein [Haloechinothrix aidingensis]